MTVARTKQTADRSVCVSLGEALERLEIVLDSTRRLLRREKDTSKIKLNVHAAYVLRRASERAGVTVRELVVELGMSKARVSQLIDELADEELVLADRETGRRRFKFLKATAKGKALLRDRDLAIGEAIVNILSRRTNGIAAERMLESAVEVLQGFKPPSLFD